MTFTSTAISGSGSDWTMDGQLTINGTTRPVSFAVEFGGEQDFFGSVHAGFAAEGVVDRRDYGLVWKLLPGAPDIAVVPIVAVLGAVVPYGQVTSMDVTVIPGRRLVGLLRSLPPTLTPERALEVAAQINRRLDARA